MKTPLLFISSFLSTVLLCAAANATSPSPVLDADGKPIKAGVNYYVIPVTQNHGGGLDLASTGKQKCPKSVVQAAPKALGNTIAFHPVNPKDAVVRNGTNLNIEFPGIKAGGGGCPESNFWKITSDPESTDYPHYIVSGGQKGHPEVYGTLSSWFMILKTEKGYKFNFCPDAVCQCNPVCEDVGISNEKGKRLLELGNSYTLNHPLEVNFKRAA